jgi:hypothetical protein
LNKLIQNCKTTTAVIKYVLICLVSLFIFSLISYSQQDSSKQAIGKIHITKGGDYSVTVIFHRNKQAIVVLVTACDSLPRIIDFLETARKYGNDVVPIFHRITYRKPGTNKEIELDVDQYNQKAPEVVSKARQEIDSLKKLNFISGTIYFSGDGFTNVASAKVVDKARMGIYFGRSVPGTTITFENCIYKNPNGSLSQPLNTSVKLD